jgi:hypothetical protein
MARRLSDDVLQREGAIPEGQIGKQFCRNCGGGIVRDGTDHREQAPHRRVCPRCNGEYGTTLATLHPPLEDYSDVRPGFYSKVQDQPSQK